MERVTHCQEKLTKFKLFILLSSCNLLRPIDDQINSKILSTYNAFLILYHTHIDAAWFDFPEQFGYSSIVVPCNGTKLTMTTSMGASVSARSVIVEDGVLKFTKGYRKRLHYRGLTTNALIVPTSSDDVEWMVASADCVPCKIYGFM